MNVCQVVQYYKAHSPDRQKELNDCLINNSTAKGIKTVHVLIEPTAVDEFCKINFSDKTKIKEIITKGQMLYSELFDYCNKELSGEVCMITHADSLIMSGFDEIVSAELRSVDGYHNKLYAICRHHLDCSNMSSPNCCSDNNCGMICRNEPTGAEFFLVGGAIDGWVFVSPVKNEILDQLKFQQNHWTGECAVVFVFKTHGYLVESPTWLNIKHNHRNTGWSPSTKGTIVRNAGDMFPTVYPHSFFISGCSQKVSKK